MTRPERPSIAQHQVVIPLSPPIASAAIALVLSALPAPATAAPALGTQITFSDAAMLPPGRPPAQRAVVCVVDTGTDPDVSLQHALTERLGVLDGTGVVNLPRDRDRRRRHGTRVSQVIAGQSAVLRTGVWPGAKLRTVAAHGPRRTYHPDSLNLAVGTCLKDPNVRVINLSLGDQTTRKLHRTIAYALSRALVDDVNVVVSAGNTPDLPLSNLTQVPGVISVGGVNATGRLCASTHDRPTIVAMACGVQVTMASGRRITASGTSFAAPQVSAVLAAMRDARPDLSADQAADALVAGGKHTVFAPILNARGAMAEIGVELAPSAPLPSPDVRARALRGRRTQLTITNRPPYARTVIRTGTRVLRNTTAGRVILPPPRRRLSVTFELGGVSSPTARVRLEHIRTSPLSASAKTHRAHCVWPCAPLRWRENRARPPHAGPTAKESHRERR